MLVRTSRRVRCEALKPFRNRLTTVADVLQRRLQIHELRHQGRVDFCDFLNEAIHVYHRILLGCVRRLLHRLQAVMAAAGIRSPQLDILSKFEKLQMRDGDEDALVAQREVSWLTRVLSRSAVA